MSLVTEKSSDGQSLAVGLLQPLLRSLVELLAPSHCLLCHLLHHQGVDPWLCDSCKNRLPRMSTVIELPISTVLQKQLAFGLMQDGMIELVHVCKFQRQRGLVRTWTELIISQPHLVDFIRSADALIPVPMHPQRLRQRGFNQAQLLAQQLAKISQKPHFPRALKKILPTEAQSALNRQQRQANLRNAFVVDFEHLQLPSSAAVVLLLVDDVCTTGATLEACGRTLKTAFPNSTIVALTLAFTPLSAF